ncbi:histidine--tRNA ligase [Calditerricola satsumensis]|uniref:Histidine--tRNA ligase n=2 Tax=Calditerricola satsumensis TaxID=373054 RepID=A0A8J3BIC7_9BACI|nr:histidine--tRNA ligase [Calditerricola satsumensis]GGK05850.1 histidine--tRNA ligase [Calditerricola satsumensis]
MAIQKPRGTEDILPGQAEAWQYVERKAREWFARYRYREIRTPLFEHTELFQRGVGETTDIVEKEMYTFADRKGRSLTLRPEGTAGVVRAFVEHKLYAEPDVVKLYYLGPMFRYERPQAGRQRQFHQIGVEAFGSADPRLDAEVMELAWRIFTDLGVQHLRLDVNSVGCPMCRPRHRQALVEHLAGVKDELCPDCQSRLVRNPLRVLDCKQERCQELTQDAPTVLDHLCDACRAHFDAVRKALEALGVPYAVNPRLVRGLDYYTQTAFEFVVEGEGHLAGTICGGGRYNGLVAELGGPDVPGIGFAFGVERLLYVLAAQGTRLPADAGLDCFVIALGEAAKGEALVLAQRLRAAGLSADVDYLDRKLKAQFKVADRYGARFAAILGDDELARGVVQLKNLATGEQEAVPLADVAEAVRQRLNRSEG